MKLKNKALKIMLCICGISVASLLSSCKINTVSKNDASIVMIKNASMSTYGTGFFIGIPGKSVDAVITSYSVVATPNGVPPKNAEVRLNSSGKNVNANVSFYDEGRNIAVLKLAESSEETKPMILSGNVDYSKNIYVRGYDGTGNIMSDFENFNTSDIVQYSGNINDYEELNTIKVYKYSNEFNRAAMGAPAVDKEGNVLGMCAYSVDNMNTYAQYILSSDELIRVLDENNFKFMTSEEVKYRNIITGAVVIGGCSLCTIIASFVIFLEKRKIL